MNLVTIGAIILGLIPLLLIRLKQSINKKFIERASTTTGVVESIELRTGYKNSRDYLATINYATDKDVMRVSHVMGFTKQSPLTKGQHVVILYDPAKPTKFSLKDYPYNYTPAYIIIGIFTVAYFIFMYFLLKELRMKVY